MGIEVHVHTMYEVCQTRVLKEHTQPVVCEAYETLNLPSTEQAVKTQPKRDKSFSFIFRRLKPLICCLMSFRGLIKGISPKICILCVRIKINKRSFDPLGV